MRAALGLPGGLGIGIWSYDGTFWIRVDGLEVSFDACRTVVRITSVGSCNVDVLMRLLGSLITCGDAGVISCIPDGGPIDVPPDGPRDVPIEIPADVPADGVRDVPMELGLPVDSGHRIDSGAREGGYDATVDQLAPPSPTCKCQPPGSVNIDAVNNTCECPSGGSCESADGKAFIISDVYCIAGPTWTRFR
jgi:hypothetical protein